MHAERHEPTDRDREIYSAPSLAEQFPIRFETDTSVETFAGCCQGCGAELPMAAVRGPITWPIGKRMANLEALGLCEPCNLLTRFQVRFYDDGRYLVFFGNRWVPGALESSAPGWLPRLGAWLRRRLGV